MARIDDLTRPGGSWSFEGARARGAAWSLGDVVGEIAAAEQRAREAGEWVLLAVAYEAAAAFDPVVRTAPRPPAGIPFVWWQSYTRRTPARPPLAMPSRVVERRRRANRMSYPDAVADIRHRIAAGDVYQVNMTDRFDGRYEGTPDDVYAALLGVQRCAFGALIDLGERVIASVSPELFFRWDGTTITCRPMKGTTARRPRPGDDAAAAVALRASPKERAENVMIVDLLRNDLGRLADTGSVTVPELFTLERYETVWQLTSTVTAEVPETLRLTEVFAALFPCGSVTGAPKIAAMDVIAELEADPRGVYCGAIGVLAPPGHGPQAVCSVPIRTAVLDPRSATFEYGAGGGITWSSDPAAEDAEVGAKARVLTHSHRSLQLLETLRAEPLHGVLRVGAHLDRMEASAGWFGYPFDRSGIEAELTAWAPGASVERVRVLSGPDGTWSVERHPLDELPVPVRLAVDTAVTRSDDPFCCHKTTWRRQYDEARARHPRADDVIIVNEHHRVVETAIANLAYQLDGRWYCPPLDDGGLPGVARAIEVAAGRLTERALGVADLGRCSALAVVNDLRGWRPAVLVR